MQVITGKTADGKYHLLVSEQQVMDLKLDRASMEITAPARPLCGTTAPIKRVPAPGRERVPEAWRCPRCVVLARQANAEVQMRAAVAFGDAPAQRGR